MSSWNRAAEKLLGYTAAEIIGQPVRRLIPHGLVKEERATMTRLKTGQSISNLDTARIKKNGRPMPVSATLSPVKDGSGKSSASQSFCATSQSANKRGPDSRAQRRTRNESRRPHSGIGHNGRILEVRNFRTQAVGRGGDPCQRT